MNNPRQGNRPHNSGNPKGGGRPHGGGGHHNPPPPHHRPHHHRGHGFRHRGEPGCLFGFMFMFGIGVAGVNLISNLML